MTEFNHHGIEGQKWGVVNGPPYPLDRAVSTGKALKSALKARHNAKVAEKYQKRAAKIVENNQKIELYKAKNELQKQKLLYMEGKSKEFFMLPTGKTMMEARAEHRSKYERDREFALKAQQQRQNKSTIGSTVKKTLLDTGSAIAKDVITDAIKPQLMTQRTKDLSNAEYDAKMAKAKYQAKHPGGGGKNSSNDDD